MTPIDRSRHDPIMIFEGIAESSIDAGGVHAYLSMAHRLPQYVAIRQVVIYHRGDVRTAFEKLAWKFYNFESLNPNFPVFRISTIISEQEITGVIALLPSEQPNLSKIVTVSYSNFWYRAVRRLVRGFYPDAMPIFFKQQEIEDALGSLEITLPADHIIHLSDVTSKEERTTPNQRKEFDTRRLWTDSPWRDVFMQAQQNGEWFTGLKFTILRERKNGSSQAVASGRIYKHGEIHYDYYHEKFSNTLIDSLEQKASERLTLFQARGIRERNYQPSEPIEISFDFDAFSDVEDIREFGNIMAKYPHSTKAVYHGNPYYHASIADYLDGSSFEMWVLSQNKVVIVPQARSSAQAFERLISYVFSEFNEGTVNVYQESN